MAGGASDDASSALAGCGSDPEFALNHTRCDSSAAAARVASSAISTAVGSTATGSSSSADGGATREDVGSVDFRGFGVSRMATAIDGADKGEGAC